MMMKKKINIFLFLALFITITNIAVAKIEELNLKSDYGYYKEVNKQKIFYAIGNAHITIDNNEVFCGEIEIYLTNDENIDKAIFKNKIVIFQEKDKIQIGGEYAEYIKKEKQFIIRENAFYIDAKEEVAVFGDSIYNYEKEEIAIIQGNVRIYQKEMQSTGAFVKYTKKDKLMEISGFPEINNQGSVYRAKKIIIDVDKNSFLLEGGLDAVILTENEDEKKEEQKK